MKQNIDQLIRSDIDSIQLNQYSFPYHHIPSSKGFPNFSKEWSFAPSYIAAYELIRDDLTNDREFNTLIDVGCGDGGFLALLADSTPSVHLTGIDLDERAIAWATLFNQHVEFFVRSLSEVGSELYDRATCIEVLEHIPPSDLPNFIDELHRIMKPGSILYVTVPSIGKSLVKKHYQHFSVESLLSYISLDKWEVNDAYYFGRRGRIGRIYSKLRSLGNFYFEQKTLNRLYINELKSPHKSHHKTGRIFLKLKRN